MLPNAWTYRRVADHPHPVDQTVQTGPFGAQLHADDYVVEGVPFILIRNIKNSRINPSGIPRISFADAARLDNYALQEGDIVFSRVGRVGSCFLAEADHVGWIISGQLLRMRLDLADLDPRFLIHWIASPYIERHILGESVGTTRQSINSSILAGMPIPAIPQVEQSKIAEILDTLDTTIRQTEAIIEKLKQVKQGLLHDLLTRGIDANGELRPPQSQAPHLYKASPLGWIPREWDVYSVGEVAESVIDGPFGSNLKTEHYVPVPGIRVIRLQNIGIGDYDDSERAYVSELKARSLSRNQVVGGDVLVAALGDERYPVGRACCYPVHLPAAVNKADCFRLRPRAEFAIGAFMMRSLNGAAARRQIRGFEQGVTMQRVNLGNLRRVLLSMPPVREQQLICEMLGVLEMTLAANVAEASKLREQKSGLMDDLLAGRVRVTLLLPPEAAS